MSIRTRLIIIVVCGLAVTITSWGFVQLRTLGRLLADQHGKRVFELAETVSQYYINFPTGEGLAALDNTLREQIMLDPGMARIDIFSLVDNEIEYIAGASRIYFEWPEETLKKAGNIFGVQSIRVETENGPALGVIYPILPEREKKTYVGIISFSRSYDEILAGAGRLLILSGAGFILIILMLLALSYRWIIGGPLRLIIGTIDHLEKGRYPERIPLRRNDEWGQLAQHFNAMAERIEQVMNSNRELNLGLEKRVQEATLNVVDLQNQVNQLQQLAALGYLTAVMAHDLGTPIHSIAGLTELLLEEEGWPPEVRRKLDLIRQQTERLNMTIAKVRQATRLPDSHFEDLGLSDLLNETIPLIEPLLARRNIQLILELDSGLPGLRVDRHRIQTALFNLIQNSSEAISANGTITIRGRLARPRDYLIISVSDTGPGIPEEHKQKVLEPFFSTHPGGGLRGLGLTIVQDIIKHHRGYLKIESGSGQGMTVDLYLPLPGLPSRTAGDAPFPRPD